MITRVRIESRYDSFDLCSTGKQHCLSIQWRLDLDLRWQGLSYLFKEDPGLGPEDHPDDIVKVLERHMTTMLISTSRERDQVALDFYKANRNEIIYVWAQQLKEAEEKLLERTKERIKSYEFIMADCSEAFAR